MPENVSPVPSPLPIAVSQLQDRDSSAEVDVYKAKFGSVGILVNGFKFFNKKKNESCIFWKCNNNSCSSTCTTTIDYSIKKYREPHNHDHSENQDAILQTIRSSVKRKFVEDSGQRPLKVVCKEVRGVEKNLKVKDIRNIKKAAQREKLKQREPLPTSTDDFVNKFMNIKTSPSLCKKFGLTLS